MFKENYCELIKYLKDGIYNYDKILFLPNKEDSEILDKLSSIELSGHLLIITAAPLKILNSNITVDIVTTQTAEKIKKLYLMYDFSDSFVMFTSVSGCYTTIFNFVKLGKITAEEMWQTLLT